MHGSQAPHRAAQTVNAPWVPQNEGRSAAAIPAQKLRSDTSLQMAATGVGAPVGAVGAPVGANVGDAVGVVGAPVCGTHVREKWCDESSTGTHDVSDGHGD